MQNTTPPLDSLRQVPGMPRVLSNHPAEGVELDAYFRPQADPALAWFCRARCDLGTARGWGPTLAKAHADVVDDRRRLLLEALTDRVLA